MKRSILVLALALVACANQSWAADGMPPDNKCVNGTKTVPCDPTPPARRKAGITARTPVYKSPQEVDVRVAGTGNVVLGGTADINVHLDVTTHEGSAANYAASSANATGQSHPPSEVINATPEATETTNVAPSQQPVSAEIFEGKVCEKRDSCGKCKKWKKPEKAGMKQWEKQFPAPTSFADVQLKRQADSLHHLVQAVWVGDALLAVNDVLTGLNGAPVANASASSSSVSVAMNAATKNGFKAIQ